MGLLPYLVIDAAILAAAWCWTQLLDVYGRDPHPRRGQR